jgi:hypothetical protein
MKKMTRGAKLKKNPCWKGYEAFGMKVKNGRTVPNCVPKTGVVKARKKTVCK